MRALLMAAILLSARQSAAYTSAWVTPFDAFDPLGWECFDEINPFALAFDARNGVYNAYPELIEKTLSARPPGVKIVPTIVNDVFSTDGKNIQTLKSVPLLTFWMGDEKKISEHAAALLEVAEPFDGLEIDYEKIPDTLWENYLNLLTKLADGLHAKGKTLAVDVEAGPLYRRRGQIASKYWPRLAAAVDRVKIMCYYERGDFSDRPGPGTSAQWVQDTVARALAVLPAAKTSLAFSLAATDWELPLGAVQFKRRVKRLHYKQLSKMLAARPDPALWDELFGSPYFKYQNGGKEHEVWFEDERSLGKKVDIARRADLGVSIWYLGAARPDLKRAGLCRAARNP